MIWQGNHARRWLRLTPSQAGERLGWAWIIAGMGMIFVVDYEGPNWTRIMAVLAALALALGYGYRWLWWRFNWEQVQEDHRRWMKGE